MWAVTGSICRREGPVVIIDYVVALSAREDAGSYGGGSAGADHARRMTTGVASTLFPSGRIDMIDSGSTARDIFGHGLRILSRIRSPSA